MNKTKIEIIRCRCGCIIAACSTDYIDQEWTKEKENKLRKGYTSEITDNPVRLEGCKCPEVKQETLGL